MNEWSIISYRDPQRERKKQDAHAERVIFWLSPHARARRKNRKDLPLRDSLKRSQDRSRNITELYTSGPYAQGCRRVSPRGGAL